MFWVLIGFAWIFGWVIIGLVGSHLSNKRRNERLQMVHAERMKAMEKGVPLPELPELEEEYASTYWGSPGPRHPRAVLGAATILATVGVGLSTVFLIWGQVGGVDWIRDLWPLGLLPIFIGLGLVFYHYLTLPEDS